MNDPHGAHDRPRLARKRLDAELTWLRAELDAALASADAEARAAAVAAARGVRDARVAELSRRGALAYDELLARFALGPLERVLLGLALANELAPDFARRFAALHGHAERTWPTAALAMETVVERRHWVALRAALGADAPLRHLRLLSLGGDPDYLGPLHQPLIVAPRVIAFASGDTRLDPTLRAHAEHWRADETFPAPLQLSPALARSLQRARALTSLAVGAAGSGAPPVYVLHGAVGSGRRRLVHVLASEAGQGTVAFDLAALERDHAGDLEAGLRLALREARLLGAVPCLRGWDALLAEPRWSTEDDAPAGAQLHRKDDIDRALSRALDGFAAPIAVLAEDALGPLPALPREVVTLAVGAPTAEAATTLWGAALAGFPLTDEALPGQLGRAYVLTPGQIAAAGRAVARQQAVAGGGEVAFAAVHEEVKAQLRHRLGDIATLITKRYAWDELVVDTTVKVQLRELVHRQRHHHQVMDAWNFRERFGRATGISALFEGPPGTGKTMAASIVAGELGLDLFQVDLSQVVSKYIGETEKQLARLFDEAERAGAVLLFDEADSLFSKRTQVSSSNDRYSNLKVNFLLQRIERFTGIAVLTTNFPESMDEAFGRRVTVRIRFPQPSIEARAALWRTMMGPCAALGEDVDFDELAERYDLSGGLIRNAVLRAAYMAAARACPIDHDLLELSARIELKQQGKLLIGDPLGDLATSWATE